MKWVCEFVNRSSPALDVLGYHMYVLGSGSDSQLVSKLTSPYALSRVSSGARVMLEAASNCTMNANKRIQVWASESSSANSSGRKNVTNTFANSFWYVDQLGQLAKLSHSVFCRQAFIGGFYEMIDQRSLEPNPDFWIALLWKRIMGPGVVSIEREHWSSSFLRVYSHVSKTSISFALSNLHEVDSFKIYFNSDGYGHIKQRNEYVLSPPDGDILSQQIHLNQRLLSLNPDGTLPGLEPIKTKSSSPMILDPRTIVFVEFMLPEAAIDATF
jgi:heparanase 1